MGCGASAGKDIFKAVEDGNDPLIRSLVLTDPATATAARNSQGDTVLHHAVLHEPGGKVKCLEALLEAPSVRHDMTNKAGWTPLHTAAAHGREAPMRTLLRFGASCTASEPNAGSTPLHFAAEHGHESCLQAAVDCQTKLDVRDNQQRTPLHIAAKGGQLGCVEALLRGSAAVNAASAESSGGLTPLHEAASSGHKLVALALVKAGADLQLRSVQGSLAVDLALANGHQSLATKLGATVKEEDAVRGIGGETSMAAAEATEGLVPTDEATRVRVQELMDATWKGVTTRDRGYAKVAHFEVVHVSQNLNAALWAGYTARRENLSLHYVEKVDDVKTVVESWEAGLQEPRLEGVNEFFLFHGTQPSAAIKICSSGFNVDLSGSNKGSLYGPGVYCAESSAKADEYAGDDEDGLYKGLFAMLLCRVSLGNPLVNEEVQPDVGELTLQLVGDSKHCIIGDREKARGTFREFVLRDPSQVFPAYAIIYRRVEA